VRILNIIWEVREWVINVKDVDMKPNNVKNMMDFVINAG
jgi:hypothetical protein